VLEDYRGFSDLIGAYSASANNLLVFMSYMGDRLNNQKGPAASLTAITKQREKLARLSGNLKALHASARNLLTLHDGRNIDPGSLQLISVPSLSSMMQYLVNTSGDVLETIPVIDTTFQNAFIIVRFRDGENLIPLF
jgi:hypothetical protein